jgi:tetratricopeptide (TPR) repeat protein
MQLLTLQLQAYLFSRLRYLSTNKKSIMKHLTFYTCIGFLLIQASALRGQSDCFCETFSKEMQQKFEDKNLKQNFDAAWQLIGEVKQNKSTCCLAIAHTMEAILLNTIGKAQASFDSAKLAMKILGNKEHEYINLEANRMLGMGYGRQGKFDSSAHYYLKSLEHAETLNKKKFLPKIYANISVLYINQKQNDIGLLYQKKSLQAALAINDTMSIAQSYANVVTAYGNLYEQTENRAYLDSAKNISLISLQYAWYSKLPLLMIRNYLSKTKFELADNHFAVALTYSDSVLEYTDSKTNPLVFFSAYIDRGNCFLGLGQNQDAIQYFEKALELTAKTSNAFTEKQIFGKLWEAHKANGDNEKALNYLEKYKALSDSLVNVDNARIIDEMEKKYNQAKNERTIKELAQEKQIYLLMAVAGLLAVAAIVIYLRQQSLKHKKDILETEQRLNRARMNPHFFFNALTALQKFAMTEPDGTVMASNLSKFSHIMRETLESTYKEYVTIEQEMEFLREYLEVQRLRFPQAFSFEILADTKLDITDVIIPAMIIQPFVENTIEHGFSGIDYRGMVTINFSSNEKEVQIVIIDNGKGLNANPKENNEHISRASQIIKDRIYLLNIKLKSKAGFSIDNGRPSGVVVKINLPLLFKTE